LIWLQIESQTMPSVPNGFIANIHATLMKQVFYISKREWKSHIQHYRKLDYFRAGFEIAKGYRIGHSFIANFQSSIGQPSLF